MSGAGDTETVVVIRPKGRDAFGDETIGDQTETELDGCLFAPGPSTEPGFAANQVITDATIYAPVGTVVYDTDRIRARGDTYSVVGKPQVWGTSGVVIALREYKA